MAERKILYYKHYFIEFYNGLKNKAKEKVDYAIMLLKSQNRLSEKFVKHIADGIFELRAQYRNSIYRIFFIFDKGNIVLLMNGFKKKTQKTPASEIELAKRIKKEYYESK